MVSSTGASILSSSASTLSSTFAAENEKLLIGSARIQMSTPEAEVDRSAEQRQGKRERAEINDLSTPPRRSDVGPARTCEVGVQATVDMHVIDTQTETSLPGNVPAIWHCQMPTSTIDMSRTQVADAADDRDEEDNASSPGEAPPVSDEDLGQVCPDSSVTPVVTTRIGDTSQEVVFHPFDEAGGSRNVSEPIA